MTILFGEPMAATSTAVQVRQKVEELSCAYFDSRKPRRNPLGEYFIRAAQEHWRRPAIADTSGKALAYGETLAAALALTGKLEGLLMKSPFDKANNGG